MQIFVELPEALVCFWLLSVFFAVTGFNNEDHRTVEVVGLGECADCGQNNVKNMHAFSGLRIAVDCKSPHGHFRTRGAGALDEYGNFKVSLPQDMVEDGELKEDCYAKLHSASAEPCPSQGNSKIVTKSVSEDTHTLAPAAGKLTFSSALCTSAFFRHFFKHHPQFPYPPKDDYSLPPPVPVYEEPLPPAPVPTYKQPPISTPSPVVKKPCPPKEKTPSPPPIYKPLPPPTPIYQPLPPPTPIYEPLPPPTPIYEPLPPPTPIYKPLPPPTPIYEPLPPPTPIYEPLPPPTPIYQPLPPPTPIYEPTPSRFNKPCPPLPKMETPKFFYQHPRFGN